MQFLKKTFLKKTWYKFIPSITMIIVTTILLTYVSYSWIRREWSPRIEQAGITIATGNTLAFVFDEENPNSAMQDFKDLLGVGDFQLKSVSNLTGLSEDFFSLEADPQRTGAQYYRLMNIRQGAGSVDDTQIGITKGYVDVTFTVRAPRNDGYTRYIYIDTDSILEGDPEVLSAIRIAVTLSDREGDTRGTTYLFGSSAKQHKAINNVKNNSTAEYLMNGQRRYQDELDETGAPIPLTQTEDRYDIVKDGAMLHTFDEFNGNKEDLLGTTLFPLENGQDKVISVRIWAEGEDENCTSMISGKEFNLMLKFSALIISE